MLGYIFIVNKMYSTKKKVYTVSNVYTNYTKYMHTQLYAK